MIRRNTANYLTFDDVLIQRLEIQSFDEGLIIYGYDATVPIFATDARTNSVSINGDLHVIGNAQFDTINVDEYSVPNIQLGTSNLSDTWDIGFYGMYVDESSLWTGLLRDADDSLKRWTFFRGLVDQPTTAATGLDSTTLAPVRMSAIYVLDGSAAAPSITFHNDTLCDTGLYLSGQNEIGIAAGGVAAATISATSMLLHEDLTLGTAALWPVGASASAAVGIDVGRITCSSEAGLDTWLDMYSAAASVSPETYSGMVFSSPGYAFFATNTGSAVEWSANTTGQAADYRDGATDQLLVIAPTYFETRKPATIPVGALGNLAVRFRGDTTTGMYRSTTGTLAIISSGSTSATFGPSSIVASRPVLATNGSVSAPAVAFSDATSTGLYHDAGSFFPNCNVAVDGALVATFQTSGDGSQLNLPIGGIATWPSLAFNNSTGLYSPEDGSITMTQLGNISAEWSAGELNLSTITIITPSGYGGTPRTRTTDSSTVIAQRLRARDIDCYAHSIIDAFALSMFLSREATGAGHDSSPNGYDASVVGSVSIRTVAADADAYVLRDVLDFSANSSGSAYLDMTQTQSAYKTAATTLSFWFKIDGALAANATILHCYKTTGAKSIAVRVLSDADTFANALEVAIESDALTTMQFHTATAADPAGPSIVSIKDGKWHHVAIHIGQDVVAPKRLIYLDGVELSVATNTIYFSSPGNNGGAPSLSTNSLADLDFDYMALGGFFNGTTLTQKYAGWLKDVYITARLLTEEEILQLATEPTLYAASIDVARLSVSSFYISAATFASGSAAAPSITFADDTATGFYLSAPGVLGAAADGVEVMTIENGSVNIFGTLTVNGETELNTQQQVIDGSAATPSYSFQSDSTSGLYNIGGSAIGLSAGGTLQMAVSSTETTIYRPLVLEGGFARAWLQYSGASLNITADHCVIEMTRNGNASAILPAASSLSPGQEITIIKRGATGSVHITTTDLIDGAYTEWYLNNIYDRMTFICNGADVYYSM